MTDQEAALGEDPHGTARKGSNAKPIGVLIKAFGALEAMADLGEPAPLRDIAGKTGLPKGTLFRVLQTLVRLGYVAQMADGGAYYLTSKLSFLGRNARQEDIKVMLLGPMKQLHQTFNETVNLGVLDAPFVRYVAVLEARRALSWGVPAGTQDLYHCTALGRAIAAHLPPEHRAILVEQTQLTSRTARTVISRAALDAILDEARATGIAMDVEENDDGVVCIGAPVFVDGKVVASLSVSVPSGRYTPALGERIGAHLRDLDLRFTSPGPA